MKKLSSVFAHSLITILLAIIGLYQPASGQIIIQDNFENGNLNQWVGPFGEIGSSDPTYGFITNTQKYEGSYSFQVTIPAMANEGGKLRFSFSNNSQRVIYVRWYQKWNSNWIWPGVPPNGTKMLILLAGNAPSPTQADLQFYAWIDSSTFPNADISNYINGQTKYSGYPQNLVNKISIAVGKWYCFEYMIDAGSPGNSDGAIKYWIDNTLVADHQNLKLLPLSSYSTPPLFHWLILTTYMVPPISQTQSTWYDAFVMSTNRIGCLTANDSTPPAPPLGLLVK